MAASGRRLAPRVRDPLGFHALRPAGAEAAEAVHLLDGSPMQQLDTVKIGVIGLGYVGLPLAVEFGKRYATLGFDIDASRVAELRGRYRSHAGSGRGVAGGGRAAVL